MPTIAATVYPAEAYVRLDVSWSDQPDVEYARVIRVNTVTGDEVTVKPYVAYNAAGDMLLDCSEGIWWDTDPPLGVALQYRTEAADTPTNHTANPSFESGVAPWTVVGGTLAQSGVFAHSGAFSGLLTPTGGATFANTVTQTGIPVTALRDVLASVWVLSPQGWNTVRLQLQWFNGSTQTGLTEQSPIEIVDDAEWRQIQLATVAPAEATTATLIVQVSGFAPATTLFYLDEIELTQPDPNTAYALSAVVTVTGTSPWYLKDPLYPCGDQALARCMPGPQIRTCDLSNGMMVQNYQQRETYDGAGVALNGVNRPRPIPQVRPRRDAETTLTVITRTFVDRDSLKATFARGTVLLVQGPAEYGLDAAGNYIFIPGGVQIDAPIPDKRIQPRFFTAPHMVVDRPPGPMNGPCGLRVADLCDIYTSWAAMKIAGLTWEDLLLGAASYSSPGVDTSGWRTFDQVEAEFVNFDAVDDGVRTFTDLLEGN